jgi:hypothetical protein
MSLSHYEAVPPSVQAQLHSEYLASRGQQEEE